jgi:hypothetical protein
MSLKLSQLHTLWSYPNTATYSEADTMNARYHPGLPYMYAEASVQYQIQKILCTVGERENRH